MDNCSLCPEKFHDKKELKNHLMSDHGGLRVVCPWCTEERAYKRVPDLKAHVKQSHPHQLVKYSSELITESNCIWFSLDPKAYRKVIEGSPWGSSAATHARILVLDWLSRARRSSRRKDEWQQGWEEMKNVVNVPYPELLFGPDYDPEYESDAASTPMPEEYCPSDPHVAELEVEHVDLARKKITVRQGKQVFSVSLHDKILEDARSLSSITRKMAVQNKTEEPPFKKRKLITSTTVRSRLTKFIGIEAQYVEKVEENIRDPVVQPPKRRERSLEHRNPVFPPTKIKENKSKPYTSERPALPDSSASTPKETAAVPELNVPSKDRPSRNPDLTERARNLLMRGCLPLFPPARRNWDDKTIALTTNGTNFTWPPIGWKDFTPDRRLLSWEFAALTIQQAMDPTLSNVIERTDLLDKFNFLALPGTIEKPVKKSDQIKRKTRYYIYEQLKKNRKWKDEWRRDLDKNDGEVMCDEGPFCRQNLSDSGLSRDTCETMNVSVYIHHWTVLGNEMCIIKNCELRPSAVRL
jgi:hypothetical protein